MQQFIFDCYQHSLVSLHFGYTYLAPPSQLPYLHKLPVACHIFGTRYTFIFIHFKMTNSISLPLKAFSLSTKFFFRTAIIAILRLQRTKSSVYVVHQNSKSILFYCNQFSRTLAQTSHLNASYISQQHFIPISNGIQTLISMPKPSFYSYSFYTWQCP